MSILNPNRRDLPGPSLLHELIAETDDDAIALEFLQADDSLHTLSYGDFRASSQSLARQIRNLLSHSHSPSIVPVVIPQCPELYVAWRAVLQAGACFCPVSPDVPPERLKFILSDVSAELVLTIAETTSLIQSVATDLVCLSVALEALQDGDDHDMASVELYNISPQSPAYVMYTSGSTGLPKGVLVSHASVTQSLLAHDEHVPTFKRFLQFASPTFDVSIFEIFFPFFRGATLVGRTREHMLADLPGTIVKLDADAAELTPTVAGTLLQTRAAAPCLQVLLTIGEMLTKSVVAEFGGDEHKPSILFAMYGPTEAAIHCTVAPRISASATVRTIGKPFSTVTALVLKENEGRGVPEVSPCGEAGELAISGQLADQYLNRPEQNKAAFVHVPGHGTVYLTGDRALCNEDGDLEILGRMSAGQVKLRGQRVELGEVEEVAAKARGVSQTVACVIDDALVLFCAGAETVTVGAVQATCKSWLPPFMRPSEILLLGEALPRLSSGKVDRKKLENDYRNQEHAVIDHDEMMDPVERLICSIFQDELHRPVLARDDLWANGMDSLRAIKVASVLRSHFPTVTMRTIMTSTTAAELAATVSGQNGHLTNGHSTTVIEDSDEWIDIEESVRGSLKMMSLPQPLEVLPCTSIQIAMLAETVADSSTNFNTITLERRDATEEQLWEAMCNMAERVDILRSGFVQTDNDLMPFARVTWPRLVRSKPSLCHPLQIIPSPDAAEETSSLCIHHAIYDGWSWELLLDDLNTILGHKIPPERTSFHEVSRLLRGQLPRATSERALSYWNSVLCDCEHTMIPSLVATHTNGGSRISLQQVLDLPYKRISKASADLRLSRQAFVQACWSLVLSAYTGSEDVLFGTVVSGRHAAVDGIQGVIGPCLATLPTRLRLGRVQKIRDLLSYAQRQNLESLEYYDTPLRDIRSAAGFGSEQTLFDSIVVWQEGPQRGSRHRQYVENAGSSDALSYTIVLEVEPVGPDLRLKITANSRMIDYQQCRLLVEQINFLFGVIVSQPDQCIEQIWASAPGDILSLANPDYKAFHGNCDITRAVSRWAHEIPDQVAIKFVHDFDPTSASEQISSISYLELHRWATSVMRILVSNHGVRPDDLVCVYASKSVNLYVTILAIMMSGAGYMCIDNRTPLDRVKHILQQAHCALVIVDGAPNSHHFDHTTVSINQLLAKEKIAPPRDSVLPQRAKGDHLAYAVFTSGTTGVPKGVMITRLNLASHLAHLTSVYPHQARNSLLQACSPAFDVSVFEIFWTWHVGMTLVAASNDVLFRDIEHFINHFDVTHLSMTPSVAALIDPDEVPNVKMLVTAGEPMNSKVFRQWSGRALYQGYGPSETTNICNVRPNVQSHDASNNVGPVFPNTSAFVCQRPRHAKPQSAPVTLEEFQLMPKGAAGEIWIGGDQVGRGYVDPKLTRHSFLDHPVHGWLYRSGDIGRVLVDGTFVILGREDDQAKLRGQRIELGEINHGLLNSGLVNDATTLVDETQKSARLIAFVVLGGTITKQHALSELFRHMEKSLPSYMVPDAIVPIGALPLTRQGKIDRPHLLVAIDKLSGDALRLCWRQHTDSPKGEPLEGVALQIAQALSVTLGISLSDVGLDVSFYQLGLDSLSSIRFSQQLRKRGLPQTDVSTILRCPSISSLQSALQTSSHQINTEITGSSNTAPGLQNGSRYTHSVIKTDLEVEKVLPCTDLQLSMLSSSAGTDRQAYRNKILFQIKGHPERLRRAWHKLHGRQQLLRTAFLQNDDPKMPYVQAVVKNHAFPWYDDDQRKLQEVTSATPSYEWYRLEVSCQNGVHFLMLDIHHALYDAVAMNRLLREVEATYHGTPLAAAVPFDNYIAYGASLGQEIVDSFWRTKLESLNSCRLGNILSPEAKSRDWGVVDAKRTSILKLTELRAFAKQHSTTVLACLQAAIARLLMSYQQSPYICFGNIFSGRNLPVEGISDMIGPCFNTLPVPARADKNTSSLELIKSLQGFNMDVLQFQPSSLRRIQQRNSPDGIPMFDTLLLLQQNDQRLDESIWRQVSEEGDMDFPFIFEVSPDDTIDHINLTLHSTWANHDVLSQMIFDFDEQLLDTVRYSEAVAFRPKRVHTPNFLRLSIDLAPTVTVNGDTEAFKTEPESLSSTAKKVRDTMLALSQLEVRHITAATTIFKLGLDSINAVQLASRLRDQGYKITSTQILQGPSLGEIAAICATSSAAPEDESSVRHFDFGSFDKMHRYSICDKLSLKESDVAALFPCTPLQDGIISQYLRSSGKLYYNTLRFRVHPEVQLSKVVEAWRSAMYRHDMLRTGFAECEDEVSNFLMVVYRPDSSSLPLEESGKETDSNDDLVLSLRRPPWRLSLETENRVVVLSILHALYDAQSLGMVLADIARHCFGTRLPRVQQLMPTVSTILSSIEKGYSQQFWSAEENRIQPTKFPNLHIKTYAKESFDVARRTMVVPLTKANYHCAELECTLQSLCQVAWARLLSAYTGQDRVTFGTILSGRAFGDERDESAFPCINTLPFTMAPANDIRTLLQTASSTNAGLLSHQQTPLTSIKRWQGLEDDAFNTVIALQKYESKIPEDAPWDIVDEIATAEYGISLEILPDLDSDRINLQLTFSENLIPKEAANIILGQLEQQVSTVMQSEQDLSGGEATAMLSILSPLQDRIPSEVSLLHEFVERSARLLPSHIALEFIQAFNGQNAVKQAWTYQELNTEGNRIANLLFSVGAKTGDLIATCFDKCPEASFAILGVLKAGCAYVAIDPGAPTDRKKFILGDAKCRVLLTTSDKIAAFDSDNSIKSFAIDNEITLDNVSSEQPSLTSTIEPASTCYCLYTSGTTGTPKGCLISHDSAVQAMMSFRRIFKGHWNADSRWLQFASFHFDVSVLEQYWSWSVGICMTSAPRDLILEDLATFLRLANITHLDLTPSLARLITPDDVPSLCDGVFIVGGEQVSQDIIETWGDAGCLYNFYGPSEVTIGCTVHPRVRRGTKPTNIGQLWDNVGALVLQPNSEDAVLRGAVGELCLTGALVGKGYLSRPELTQEKFAVLSNGQRVYRTGDLVRLLHDDSFEFLGRIDGQVKLRGQRLEVGEIDQVIKSATNTISAVATMVLRHQTQGKEHLVAFLTTSRMNRGADNISFQVNHEASELAARVRRHCMNKLPGYMVPTEIFVVTSMPLSANNKVEMKVLQKLYENADLDGNHAVRKEILLTPQDQQVFGSVANAIAQRLHIPSDTITPGSRLFELGLDSVSAIGMARVLRNRGFENASIQVVMRSPLVADLVHALKQSPAYDAAQEIEECKRAIDDFAKRHRSAILRALDVDMDRIENISPCTPLQEGMISKAVNSSAGDSTYFSEFSFEVAEDVNLDRLCQAWRAVAAVTSILRTRFVPTADGYAQVVLVDDRNPVHLEDHLRIPDGAFDEFVGQARVISGVQLWRVALSSGPRALSMKLFIFHGLYDGVALDLLLEKVAKSYDAVEGTPMSQSRFYELLPHGPLATLSGSEAFWKERTFATRLLNLTVTDEDMSNSLPSTMQSDCLQLPDLSKIASDLNVTPPSIFHAVWLFCLERHYHVNPTLGLVVSGRSVSHEQAESIIGPMFNTIPCTVGSLNDGATIEDLIKACHKFSIDALPHQHTPLRHIAKWLGIDASKRLFDCLFVYQRERTDAYEHDHWRELASTTGADYPLNLEVEQKKDGTFTLVLVGRADSISQMECAKLLNDLVSLLERLENGGFSPLPKAFTDRTDQRLSSKRQKEPRVPADRNASDEVWTAVSRTIRSEVARLANVSTGSMTPTSPSLFELGLDSIDVMKLATRLRQAGIKAPISSIMRAPTIDGIAAAALKAQSEPKNGTDWTLASSSLSDRQSQYRAAIHAQGVDSSNIEVVLPVTAMQEGLLLDYGKYYNVIAFELLPDTNIDRLIQAWQVTAASQDILRTRFVSVGDEVEDVAFLQAVSRTPQLEIQHSESTDLSSAMSTLRDEAADRGLAMPIVKMIFLKQNDRRIMLLGMPHAAYDGWSIQLLQQAVNRAYQELPQQQPNHATETQGPQDHIETVLGEAISSATRAFWERTVRYMRPTILQSPSQSHPNASPQLLQHKSMVSLADAQRCCQRAGITLQSLGLAAYSAFLACRTSTVDICFGLVLSGRTTEGSNELIFPTFNTVLFSTHIDAQAPAIELVRAVHDQALGVSEHQHYPLKETLKLSRQQHGQGEMFNTLFTYQKTPTENAGVDEICREVESDDAPANPPYAVNIELEAKADTLMWTLGSQKGVYAADEARDAIRALDRLLEKLVRDPDECVFTDDEQSNFKRAHASTQSSDVDSLSTQTTTESALELSDSERLVRDVLAETSKTDPARISKSTNIFNLGFDSISAIKLASNFKKRGLKIPISKIIEAQTVERMAAAAELLKQHNEGHETSTRTTSSITVPDQSQYTSLLLEHGIAESEVEEVLPVTAGQQYMLDVWQASDRQLLYPSFWFDSTVSEEIVTTAIQTLIGIEPMLRTTFLRHGQAIVQVRLTPAAVRAGRVTTPWSFKTQRRGNTNLFLTLHIHHALYDAVSIRILTDRLDRLCRDLSPLPPSNDDVHAFLAATHSSPEARTAQRAFWTNYLRPATHPPYPPPLNTSAFTPRTTHFTPHLHPWASLTPRLRAEGVSAQALFFALIGRIYAATLLTQPDHVVLGIYLSNRALDVPHLPTLAAPTVNIVPLLVNVAEGVGIQEAAREVQRDLGRVGMAANCGVSLREVWEWTGKGVKVGCVVNWLSLPGEEGEGEDEDGDGDGDQERVVWHADEEVRREIMGVDNETEALDGEGSVAKPSPFINGTTNEQETRGLEWIVPSIDIEAKIEGGYLAMGLFGPTDLVGGAQGMDTWFESVRDGLLRAEGKGKERALG